MIYNKMIIVTKLIGIECYRKEEKMDSEDPLLYFVMHLMHLLQTQTTITCRILITMLLSFKYTINSC